MKQLGPYRKGKKAFKLNKHNKVADRYRLLLLRIETRRRQGIKLSKIVIIAMMGAMEITRIRQAPNAIIDEVPTQTKEWALFKSILNTSTGIQQILNQP